MVYIKLTIRNIYLKSGSHHYPSTKQTILSVLVHWAGDTGDCDSLQDALKFLKADFKENGYSQRQIWWVLHPLKRVAWLQEDLTSVDFLPYSGMAFDHINRLLFRHGVKCVGLPPCKAFSLLHPVKDDLGFKTPDMYSISCKCVQFCSGQPTLALQPFLGVTHIHDLSLCCHLA
jgi:hypothetical protein